MDSRIFFRPGQRVARFRRDMSSRGFFSAAIGSPGMLLLVTGCLLACADPSSPSLQESAETVSAATEKASPKRQEHAEKPAEVQARFDESEYVVDGESIPQRAAARRIFLRRSRVNSVRDPFLVDNEFVYFVAKVAGVQGLWKLALNGNAPAELVTARPRIEQGVPLSRKNRSNWFIGTPRPFPDGKHAIFGGSSQNPQQQYTNVLGVVSLQGGPIAPIEVQDVKIARTPDVHPNGKTIVFSSCDGLRLAEIDHRGEQSINSRVLVEIPRQTGVQDIACTAFRPRFSPDGQYVVFELVGRFASAEFRDQHQVPTPQNAGDFVLMPWRVRYDGTGLAPLIPASIFEALGGRVQTGGTQDPVYSPDGNTVAFNHGHRIGIVQGEGKSGQILLGNRGLGGDGEPTENPSSVRFHESDPVYSPDGNLLISASRLQGASVPAPPGFTILNVKQAMARAMNVPGP